MYFWLSGKRSMRRSTAAPCLVFLVLFLFLLFSLLFIHCILNFRFPYPCRYTFLYLMEWTAKSPQADLRYSVLCPETHRGEIY